MSEQYTKTEIDLLTKPIVDGLTSVRNEVKEAREDIKQHGENIINMSHDIANLYKVVSTNSGNIKVLQELRSKEEQQELSQSRAYRERAIWIFVSIVIFLLGFVGIINVDFIKAIL